MKTNTTTKNTTDIVQALSECNNAALRFEDLAKIAKFDARKIMNQSAEKLRSVIREFKFLLGENSQSWKTIEAEIIDNEHSLQLANIMNMYLALPKAKRDEIEDYVSAQYNVYALNKNNHAAKI